MFALHCAEKVPLIRGGIAKNMPPSNVGSPKAFHFKYLTFIPLYFVYCTEQRNLALLRKTQNNYQSCSTSGYL